MEFKTFTFNVDYLKNKLCTSNFLHLNTSGS